MKAEPRRLDVFLVRAQLGHSIDCRPCIVVEPPQNEVVVVLVSASDLYNPDEDFRIDAARSEFRATGLRKSSFAVGRALVAVPLASLGKRLGHLEGNLAAEFNDWLSRRPG